MTELVTFVCSDCGHRITEDARNTVPGVCLECRYWRFTRGELTASQLWVDYVKIYQRDQR
jgi:DNA-directed RNA polymerase subunit RPC12/RpoP